jgi:hypothetical protein
MDPKIVAMIEQYAQTHGFNLPPHQIVSDMVAEGPSGVEQLLAMLGMTVNAGDPSDNAKAQLGQAQREAKLNDATTKFPANEEASASKLGGGGGGGEDLMKMVESMPQTAAQIAGSLSGALIQPFTQIMQTLSQSGNQLLQTGLGAFTKGASAGSAVPASALGAELGAGGKLGGTGGGGAGAGGGGTSPAAMLGPPPTPAGNTAPASSPHGPPIPPAPGEPSSAPRGAGGGMPMMSPAGMQGAGGAGSNDKPGTKRVVPPSVKNGAPIQGRLTSPLRPPEVIKRVEGKPVASRRILAPDLRLEDDEDAGLSRRT